MGIEPDHLYLRAISETSRRLRIYEPMRRVMARIFGGYVLVFHDLFAGDYVRIIEALEPDKPVGLCELLERVKEGRSTAGLFAITVDDGVGDTARALAVASIERKWPVTFFLPTGYLDRTHEMYFMTWRNVLPYLQGATLRLGAEEIDLRRPRHFREFVARMRHQRHTRPRQEHGIAVMEAVKHVIDAGLASETDLAPPEPVDWQTVAALSRSEYISFESHGVSHTAAVALSDEELTRELLHSRYRISEHTGRPVRCFAYPFGTPVAINERVRNVARRHYEWSVTDLRGRLNHCDRGAVPRIPVYARDLNSMVVQLKVLTAT